MKLHFLILSVFYLVIGPVFSQEKKTSDSMKTALIIIDIQNDYFTGGAHPLDGPEKAADNAKMILEKFRAEKLPVIHVQHKSKPTGSFFKPETKGFEINERVRPLPGEKVIVKHFPNGFQETDLLDYLRSNRITDLVICGMMTHMCVDATVRAAKDFGFNITLIGDACATRDLVINGKTISSEDVHNAFLAALNGTYAKIETTGEFLREK
ncbi:MAG TPA: cysteine hydrolase family protein [Bacteroidales bacterium]|nr:cysteine hydrolase family protein [Bacteroidales bacterium]